MSGITRHVRAKGEFRKDERYRAIYPRITNRAGTLCGAEPSRDDIDRKTLAHYETYRAIKPEWVAEVCDHCRQLAPERPHESICALPKDHEGHCHDGLA